MLWRPSAIPGADCGASDRSAEAPLEPAAARRQPEAESTFLLARKKPP